MSESGVPESRWAQLLSQFTRECPWCGQNWLIVDTRGDSSHTCKACGRSFALQDSDYEAETGPEGSDRAA